MKKTLLTISMLLFMVVAFAQNSISELQRGMVFHAPLSEWYPNKDLVSGQTSTNTAVYNVPDRQGSGANRYIGYVAAGSEVVFPATGLSSLSDFTFIFKIKCDREVLLSNDNIQLFWGSSNKYLTINGTQTTLPINIAYDGLLHTYIIQRTSNVVTVYKDGVNSGNGSVNLTSSADFTSLRFGYSSGYWGFNDTYLIRLFNYALTPTQIANYSKPEYPIEWVDRISGTVGAELVTNGTFTGNADGWYLGSGFSYASNEIVGTSATGGLEKNSLNTVVGKAYNTSFYANVTSGNIAWFSGSFGGISHGVGVGTYKERFVATSVASMAYLGSYSSFSGYIDNVSVIQAGCVLDLNSSGLSRASDGSYNTGYWTDRTNSITATVSGAISQIPPASNLTATWFSGASKIEYTGMSGLTGMTTLSVTIHPIALGGYILTNTKCKLFVNSSGYLTFSRDGTTAVNSSAGSIAINNNYNVLITSTSAGVTNIYINGVLSGTANQSAGTPASGTSWVIGSDNTNYFTGYMKNVIVNNEIIDIDRIELINDIN